MSAVHCTIGGANVSGFHSRMNEATEALQTFPSAGNGVECTYVKQNLFSALLSLCGVASSECLLVSCLKATKGFGNGTHNNEPRSSDEDNTLDDIPLQTIIPRQW
ncbi:hypothetical protein TNCV_4194851 [Trichonephila clavipes]|nr:hypothetical protein TNCV_4194851 [Trichonephila clavipes]